MIFYNPSGAPELACEQCGCRWFDRMHNTCYECGAEVSAEAVEAFDRALQEFAARKAESGAAASSPVGKQPTSGE